MSQAPRKSTRATKGQPPKILDPAKGLGLASSKDTRESNAAEPLAGGADVFTTPRKDAIPASTVLDGASPAEIVAKRPGLCAKAVARKRARAGKKAAKKGADSDTSPDDNEDDVDASYDGNRDDGSEDEQVNAPARRAARALFDDDDGNSDAEHTAPAMKSMCGHVTDTPFSQCQVCQFVLCKECTAGDKPCLCVPGVTSVRTFLDCNGQTHTFTDTDPSTSGGATPDDTNRDIQFQATYEWQVAPHGVQLPDIGLEYHYDNRKGLAMVRLAAVSGATTAATVPDHANSPHALGQHLASPHPGTHATSTMPTQHQHHYPPRATHSASVAQQGVAEQARAVPDCPHTDPSKKDTWEEYAYHRDDPEPGNVLYYDIPKVNKNQGRERGARFDWACKLW